MSSNGGDGRLLQRLDEETYKVIWTIHRPIGMPIGMSYTSPRFFTGMKKENVWFLRFRTDSRYRNRETTIYCNLTLHLDDCVLPELEVTVEFFVSGRQSAIYENRGRKERIKKGGSLDILTANPDEIRNAYESGESCDGLRICCIITHAHDKALSYSSKDIKISEHGLMKDLESLMNDTKLSDIELSVKKEKFRAHKVILASRSPVFMAMFHNDMQEKISNSIDIPDIDPDIMHKLLNYIYTDTVENIEDSVEGLIAAAEKYQLEGLKTVCSKVMIERLEEENVIETLGLADLYHVDDLKKESLKFIAQHIKNLNP